MDTSINRGSATIYQFPVRERRAAPRARRHDFDYQSRMGTATICASAIDSGWYHDDAIREEKAARETIVPMAFPRR